MPPISLQETYFLAFKVWLKSQNLTIFDIKYPCHFFNKNDNSEIVFKIKQFPGWLFGLWFYSQKGAVTANLFWQYEEFIDKFKPTNSCFSFFLELHNERLIISPELYRAFEIMRRYPSYAFCCDQWLDIKWNYRNIIKAWFLKRKIILKERIYNWRTKTLSRIACHKLKAALSEIVNKKNISIVETPNIAPHFKVFIPRTPLFCDNWYSLKELEERSDKIAEYRSWLSRHKIDPVWVDDVVWTKTEEKE